MVIQMNFKFPKFNIPAFELKLVGLMFIVILLLAIGADYFGYNGPVTMGEWIGGEAIVMAGACLGIMITWILRKRA